MVSLIFLRVGDDVDFRYRPLLALCEHHLSITEYSQYFWEGCFLVDEA